LVALLKNTIKYLARRVDGFVSHVTGIGTRRDKSERFCIQPERRLSKWELDTLYAEHELCWKLVDLLPEAALRKWISISHPKSKEILTELKRIGLRDALDEALKMARLHGGCAIYLDVDDGGLPHEPVILHRIKSIRGCDVFESHYLSPKNGLRSWRHEHYILDPHDDREGMEIHRSRLLLFYGAKASRDWMLLNNGWGVSIVQRCFRPLLAYTISHGAVPTIVQDFIQGVLKMAGLNDLDFDSEQDQKGFDNRLDAMFVSKSYINELIIDKEDDYARHTTNVAGVNDLIRNPERRLVAASGMPHTILLGETPGGGLNAGKGESQEKDWSKSVSSFQERHVSPALDMTLGYMNAYMSFGDLDYTYNPLDAPSAKEQGDLYKVVAEAASKLVQEEIISEAEAATHFSGSEIKVLPTLNLKARADLASIEPEFMDDEEVA
jgi:phage-related protein (TIGR01555 family)